MAKLARARPAKAKPVTGEGVAIDVRRGFVDDMVSAPAAILFQADILGEIVVVAAFTREVPAYRLGRIAAAEHVGEKALLRRPSGLRLRLAVAARHGVVEPAMGSALVDVDVIAFLVSLPAIPEAVHVRDRDDVIGLAESPEHRAVDGGDHLIQRPRLAFAYLPFALGGGPIPDHG